MTRMLIPSDAPTWARTLIENYNKLYDDAQSHVVTQKLEVLLKDVPKVFWSKRILPATEEDLKEFVAEVKADYAAYVPPIPKKETTDPKDQKIIDQVVDGWHLGGGKKKADEIPETEKTADQKMIDNIMKLI